MSKKAKSVAKEDSTIQETPPAEVNGQGVGVYFDKKLNRYILVSLDLHPATNSATIVSTKTLGDKKLSVGLKAGVLLEQIINKLK